MHLLWTEGDRKVILHVDHKFPLARGGEDKADNFTLLCGECNTGKKDLISAIDIERLLLDGGREVSPGS